MRDQPTALLGGLSPRDFLKQHWQKKPLLVRNAFPDFTPPLTAGELAGLACEEGVESRLVVQTRKAPGWKLSHGPFKHKDFTRLPRSRWTLLVQDVDKHVPGMNALLDPFRFIPDWRIDDLMGRNDRHGGAARNHRKKIIETAANAAAMALNQLAEGDRHRLFHIAWPGHMA